MKKFTLGLSLLLGCALPGATEVLSPQEENPDPIKSATQPIVPLAPVSQPVGAAVLPTPTLLRTLKDSPSSARWIGDKYLSLEQEGEFQPRAFYTLEYIAKLWDITTGKELLSFDPQATFTYSNKIVTDIQLSADGKTILSWGEGGAVLWDTTTGQKLLSVSYTYEHTKDFVLPDFANFAKLSPDGSVLATVPGCQSRVQLWSTKSKKVYASISYKPHKFQEGDGYYCYPMRIMDISFSPDGTKLASTHIEEPTKVSDTRTGKTLFTIKDCKLIPKDEDLPRGEGDLHSAQFSPDGTKLLTSNDCNEKRNYNLWDAKTGKKLVSLDGEPYSEEPIFSSDGTKILIVSSEHAIEVWESSTGKKLYTLEGKFYSARFNADGTKIATAGEDKTARLWDANTGKELLTFNGHKAGVVSAELSPDGTKLLTFDADNIVKVWDAKTAEALFVIEHFQENLNVKTNTDKDMSDKEGGLAAIKKPTKPFLVLATFSPDGTKIQTSSRGQTKIWRLP